MVPPLVVVAALSSVVPRTISRRVIAGSIPAAALHPALAEGTVDDGVREGQLAESSISRLREAMSIVDEPDKAEPLFTQCIEDWKSADMPALEVASLYRFRASAREELGNLNGALRDLNEAAALATAAKSDEETISIRQLRASVHEGLRDYARAVEDLDYLISVERDFGVVGPGGVNPFLHERRATALQALQRYDSAATDFRVASETFSEVGDNIRAVLALTDLCLALYGAGKLREALDVVDEVCRSYTRPGSNNPDDLPLLEDLSRREAELHLVLASHYGGAPRPDLATAAREWDIGCLRLRVYQEQLEKRLLDEDRRRLRPSAGELAKGLAARVTGVAPPFANGLPGQGYWWYSRIGEENLRRRRSPMNLRPRKDATALVKGCSAFEDPDWVSQQRHWPPNLVSRLRTYRSLVVGDGSGTASRG